MLITWMILSYIFWGIGHWFLEGWIGDHSVEFLVDSGSSVTAMSDSLYQTLVRTGEPVGALGNTSRTLCGANGTGIGVSGCSHCVVSFMGLQTEFPILVCDLATGTDAIIETNVLGSVLPHTPDIKNDLLFTEGGASLHLHWRDTALSGRVFTVGHCSIPPYSEAVLHCTIQSTGGRPLPSSGFWRASHYLRKIKALSWAAPWLIRPHIGGGSPVLVSNISHDTVMVEPFSEVGMMAQIAAIQYVTEPLC